MNISQALIDLFTLEFPPEAKAKAKPAQSATRKKDPQPNQTREQYLAEHRYWTPIATVYHITEQTCQCCQDTTEVVGSILTKHQNPRQKASWECRRTPLHALDHLPKEFIIHKETVEQCPQCLRLDALMCDYPATQSHQQPLFVN